MTTRMLDVWVSGKRVGRLIQEDYAYSFQYQDVATLDPTRDLVSLTMPVRVRHYDTQVLMPPFQMALPEGALLENLRTRFGKIMDVNNDMVLLELVGKHTLGRVRCTAAGHTLDEEIHSEHSLRKLLAWPETESLFNELMEELAPRSGVAGVQPKVLWSTRAKKVAFATDRYLLKSAGQDYPGLAVNEYFCLKAAQAAGLATPRFHLAENGRLLVIERFDVDQKDHQLAFEEACALLHLSSHGKYNSSYEAMADVIQKAPCEPLTEARRSLFKSVSLSMLLRNGDAHLKNFGILYDDTTRKWLAPVYDLVTTAVYLPKDVPALTLAGSKRWPDADTLRHFGMEACGLRKRTVTQCLQEVAMGIRKTRLQVRSFGTKHRDYRDLCERMAAIMSEN